MKKLFDENETEYPGGEWAKVLVKVVPFVLILLILAVMFIVDQVKKDNDGQTENLQQNIMDYADENRNDQTLAEAVVQASPAVRDEDVQEDSL
ncbi:MAG: hypothetical protein K2G39_09450, partial [Lachnospiraceae bacterium]|nr:hypothetical protein [Lachnospiraceae bacterium]